MYNLTDSQKDLLRWMVREIREGNMPEEFYVFWDIGGDAHLHWEGSEGFHKYQGITRAKLNALEVEHLIRCHMEYTVSHLTLAHPSAKIDTNKAARSPSPAKATRQ